MSSNNITHQPYSPTKPATTLSETEVCDVLMQIIQRTRAMVSDQIIRRSQLKAKCGRASSTSYIDVAKGVFPPEFSIGERAVGFSSNEIDAWIAARSFSSQGDTPVNMKAFVTLLVQSRNHAKARNEAAVLSTHDASKSSG